MSPFDEENEGEVSIGESSDAERKITPDVPKAPSVKTFDESGNFESAADVNEDTLRAFVVCVIYTNAAFLLVSLGPMLWFFNGMRRLGFAMIVGGVLAGIRTYQVYREWDRARNETDADAPDDASADGNDDSAEEDAADGDVETGTP